LKYFIQKVSEDLIKCLGISSHPRSHVGTVSHYGPHVCKNKRKDEKSVNFVTSIAKRFFVLFEMIILPVFIQILQKMKISLQLKYRLFILQEIFYTMVYDFDLISKHFIPMDIAFSKGIYCLIVKLSQRCNIQVGRLGTFSFPVGFYVYIGSAQNNLECRIERHLQREKKAHWHIDYLLRHGRIIHVHKFPGKKDKECVLSRKIGDRIDAMIPVRGFGSSDCFCISHLYLFQHDPSPGISRLEIK